MIVAIGGPSNSGKSDLAKALAGSLAVRSTAVLCLDDFVFPESQLPRIRNHIDWEHPVTINLPMLQDKLLETAEKFDITILEGFLVFAWQELRVHFHRNLFIEIPRSVFLARKKKDLRWGLEPDWYIDHIWDQFLRFGQPPDHLSVMRVDGTQSWPMEAILDFINN